MKISELKNIIKFLDDNLDVEFKIKECKYSFPKGASICGSMNDLKPIRLGENNNDLK